MIHPLDLPVTEMAAGIRTGQFTAETVMAESLRRARAAADAFNPFTIIREEKAMESALAADAAVAQGAETGPLHGVPFAAKDITPTKGDLTTLGSWTRPNWVPDESALCVRRLEAAGAILMAKTTTPEFANAGMTASPRWGTTLNPWNPERTSGGSSGGSAVAVAANVVPFAEGTDMGGSVRIPAAFCGVVGLKPSLGRIPMTILPSIFDNISHFGPLARRVADASAFMAAAAGPSDEDIMSLPVPFDERRANTIGANLEGRRFALSMDLGYYAIAPEVEIVIRRCVDRLRDAGAVVEEVSLPWTRAINDRWLDLWGVFMSAFFGEALEAWSGQMDPAVVTLIKNGRHADATAIKQIEILRSDMWRDLAGVFTEFDALLCPTCAITAPLATATDDDFGSTFPDGRYMGMELTCPFNMVPQLPALSLPAGLATDGLPVGLQVIGRRFADEEVLAIAAEIEASIPASLQVVTP